MNIFSKFGTVNIVVITVIVTACLLAVSGKPVPEFFERLLEWVIVGYFAQMMPKIKEQKY